MAWLPAGTDSSRGGWEKKLENGLGLKEHSSRPEYDVDGQQRNQGPARHPLWDWAHARRQGRREVIGRPPRHGSASTHGRPLRQGPSLRHFRLVLSESVSVRFYELRVSLDLWGCSPDRSLWHNRTSKLGESLFHLQGPEAIMAALVASPLASPLHSPRCKYSLSVC